MPEMWVRIPLGLPTHRTSPAQELVRSYAVSTVLPCEDDDRDPKIRAYFAFVIVHTSRDKNMLRLLALVVLLTLSSMESALGSET